MLRHEDLYDTKDVVDLCQHHGSKSACLCVCARCARCSHVHTRVQACVRAAVKPLLLLVFASSAGL